MLRAVGLESVGSRNTKITPRKWTKKGAPIESSTIELFIAGKREVFRHLNHWVDEVSPLSSEATDFARIERFTNFSPEDRIRNNGENDVRFFEVGVHLLPDENSSFIQIAFLEYANQLDIVVHTDLGFRAGNLWFVPIEGDQSTLEELSKFSFVRVIRPLPRLRGLRPVMRTSAISIACDLPTEQPLSSEPKVAILDGGLPDKHPIKPWLSAYRELDPG